MTYPIVVYGHPVLRKTAEDIGKDYPELQQLIDDLFETMYRSEGVGLAAPQIGKSIRLFIIDGTPYAEERPEFANFKKVFINARITEKSGDPELMKEGCLSIPNLREEVSRDGHIRIQYHDRDWVFHDETYEGFIARVIQHEYDHLDGILFTDRVSPLRKKLIRGKLNAISKGKFEADYQTILPARKLKVH
ncbi:MAG: peptide deformylase [Bacteroidales bacterium]|nr:peptide deformylase [Bacteroidales bacterium]